MRETKREIKQTGQYKRDVRREARGQYRATFEDDLLFVIAMLIDDQQLPEKYRDHALSGDWAGFRDCHIKPDLVLIYSLPDEETLRLARLGSHSELGL
jgi:mRNA interferase YafQ